MDQAEVVSGEAAGFLLFLCFHGNERIGLRHLDISVGCVFQYIALNDRQEMLKLKSDCWSKRTANLKIILTQIDIYTENIFLERVGHTGNIT